MSSIDRLLGEITAKEQQRIQREQSLKAYQLILQEAQNQREQDTLELHLKRQQQAGNILEESGVGVLLNKLGAAVNGKTIPFAGGKSVDFDDKDYTRTHPKAMGYVPGGLSNQDSSGIALLWNPKVTGYVSTDKYSRGWVVTRFIENLLAVEARIDGSITFHSKRWLLPLRKRETLEAKLWRKDGDVLEQALVRAYHSPIVARYNGGYFEPGPYVPPE